MWDAEMGDGEGFSRILGQKEDWQEYPCIIAHSKDYALIAFSEDKGKIIDTDGRTIEEGIPRTLAWADEYDGHLFALGYDTPQSSAEYLFWQAKYPELLTR
jgi:hypothetical protein